MHAFKDAPRRPTRTRALAPAALVTLALAFAVAAGSRPGAAAAPTPTPTPTPAPAPAAAGPKLVHTVFFTMKDKSPAAREKFVASCYKYLTGHEGAVAFEVGVIADDVVEPGVSDRDFDVSLHSVFESKEAEAKYLKHPRHFAFVDENKAGWAKVRVFDTYLAAAK